MAPYPQYQEYQHQTEAKELRRIECREIGDFVLYLAVIRTVAE
jgi:hypothetical protein